MKSLTEAQELAALSIFDNLATCNASLFLADVGSGKTSIILHVLKALRMRALIVAPKLVCEQVWGNEAEDWPEIQSLRGDTLCGLSAQARVRKIDTFKGDFLTINYDLAPWIAKVYKTGLALKGYGMVVFDEVDKLKNPKSIRVRGKGRKSRPETWQPGMMDWARTFKFAIGMTGTPTPNHLLDIWAPVKVLAAHAPLGKSYWDFRQRFFYATDWQQYNWVPLPGTERMIHQNIDRMTTRLSGSGLPKGESSAPGVRVLPPRRIHMPKEAVAMYKRFQRDLIVTLEDGTKIDAVHAAAGYNRLRQMAQGNVMNQDAVVKVHRAKLDALVGLVDELMGQQLMVVYHYEADRKMLLGKFGSNMKAISGGMKVSVAGKALNEWNKGHLQLLAIQPQAAGHGLNLQHSAAKHICFFTPVESAGLYEQVVGRIARTGNVADEVLVHYLLCDGTVDEIAKQRTHDKQAAQKSLLELFAESQGLDVPVALDEEELEVFDGVL